MRTEGQKASAKRYYEKNKELVKARNKQWRLDNKEKLKEAEKWRHLWKTYKITEEEYNTLWAMQGEVCQVCKEPTDDKRLDHCHATGDIRGILCHPCNILLGHLEKHEGHLDSALSYLREA